MPKSSFVRPRALRRVAVGDSSSATARRCGDADEIVTAILVPKPIGRRALDVPQAREPPLSGHLDRDGGRLPRATVRRHASGAPASRSARQRRRRGGSPGSNRRSKAGPSVAGLADLVRPGHFSGLDPIDDVRGTAATGGKRRSNWCAGDRRTGGCAMTQAPRTDAASLHASTARRWRSMRRRSRGSPMCCATSSGSPAPRSAAMPAIAAPARCSSTASRCAPASFRSAQAQGRTVVTVEGLAEDGKLSALQNAFHRHGAAQCGICTPGMLMAASDLLARNAQAVEAGEVEDALGGVLCRCTGYHEDRRSGARCRQDATRRRAGRAARSARGSSGRRRREAQRHREVRRRRGAGRCVVAAGSIRSPHARATFKLFGDLEAFTERHGLDLVLTA